MRTLAELAQRARPKITLIETLILPQEDPYNAIASGAITGGLLAIRSGPSAMWKSALVGGIILVSCSQVGFLKNGVKKNIKGGFCFFIITHNGG